MNQQSIMMLKSYCLEHYQKEWKSHSSTFASILSNPFLQLYLTAYIASFRADQSEALSALGYVMSYLMSYRPKMLYQLEK